MKQLGSPVNFQYSKEYKLKINLNFMQIKAGYILSHLPQGFFQSDQIYTVAAT